jgi:hypothetical protein
MKIYRIRLNVDKGFAYLESEGFDFEMRRQIYMGEKINTISNEKFIVKTKKGKYPDFMGSSSIPFISDKFKKVIENHSEINNINFLPTKIEKENYWLLNIIGYLDCFDKEKSTFSTFDNGEPDEIQNIVFFEENIPSFSIFKIKESPINIFITDEFKKVIEENHISGVSFLENTDLTFG